METKLNNNEVKAIAEMQTKIDTYESFICSLYVMIETKRTDLNYLITTDMPIQKEMNGIWRFVKGNIK